MNDDRCSLPADDVVVGLDLASAEHQAVVLNAEVRSRSSSECRAMSSRRDSGLTNRTVPGMTRPGGRSCVRPSVSRRARV